MAILPTGLMAGLFFAFQCSIKNGLGLLDGREYFLCSKIRIIHSLQPRRISESENLIGQGHNYS